MIWGVSMLNVSAIWDESQIVRQAPAAGLGALNQTYASRVWQPANDTSNQALNRGTPKMDPWFWETSRHLINQLLWSMSRPALLSHGRVENRMPSTFYIQHGVERMINVCLYDA